MNTFRIAAPLLLLAVVAPAVRAQERSAPSSGDRLQLAQYLDLEGISQPRLSPDGRRIVYTRRWIDRENDRRESSLWIVDADGGRNRFLVDGSDAHWSPDGTRIAYLAEGEPSGTQVFVRWMDAEGARTQVTRLTESPSDIAWAPDGKAIAFRMLVPQKNAWKAEGAVSALRPAGAKWTDAPRIVDRLRYRQDRVGYLRDGYHHVFVVSADGGTPRQITDGEFDDGAPEWAGDGAAIFFSGLREPDAEYAWRESEIYAVDPAGGAVRRLTHHPGPDRGPVVSPDGRFVAFTGFDSTDATWQDADLYVMSADGTGRRTLTTGLDRSPADVRWAADGAGLYFDVDDAGSRNLYFVPLRGGAPRPLTRGAQILAVSDVGRGVGVGTVSTPRSPDRLVAVDLKSGALTPLVDVNADILAGKRLGDLEEIRYPSKGGLSIQGWILKPPHFDPARRYPLILTIHGGPHAMYGVGFNFAWQEWAANDYVVLYVNPRGSTGYGSAFGNAIKNAYPGDDFADLMTAVDTVIARGYVDTHRMFVYGCSGGGVLTAWTVGHTDRFAAAASLCPVIDWVSFVGETDGPGWYYNFAKLPWEDPSEHLRRSPLMYAGHVSTPTMLMTGVLDLRTPIPQTEEFYRALKLRKVPTVMVRMNGEYHGTTSKPSNFLRTQLYLRTWFERWGGTATAQRTDGGGEPPPQPRR